MKYRQQAKINVLRILSLAFGLLTPVAIVFDKMNYVLCDVWYPAPGDMIRVKNINIHVTPGAFCMNDTMLVTSIELKTVENHMFAAPRRAGVCTVLLSRTCMLRTFEWGVHNAALVRNGFGARFERIDCDTRKY